MPPEPTVAQLLARNAELEAKVRQSQSELAEQATKIKLLEQKLDLLIRRTFGRKSEQLSSAQLELLFEGLASPPPKSETCWAELGQQARRAKPPAAPKERRLRLPEHLPVREEVLEPAEVQRAPHRYRRIGQEVSERLDYEPGRFLRLRTVRPTYVLRAQPANQPPSAPVTAALPPVLLERGMFGPGLLAHVVVGKYVDHLPLYRQEGIYRLRHGVELPRQTLARAVELAAFWLEPIARELRAQALASGYVQADETPIRYLAPGHGQTKSGYLWTVLAPGGEGFFHWSPSRGAQVLFDLVPAGFCGRLQSDGYEAYASFLRQREERAEASAEESPPIVHVGCLAHVRRAFFEAAVHHKDALWVLAHLDSLYDLERAWRAGRVGARLRELGRGVHSRPILARLRRGLAVLEARKDILPKSSLGKAVRYALGQWDRLIVCLEDGRLELDNNLVENAIRPSAVGKKNWLFIGSAEAGPRAAIVYTVLASCRRHGLDPFEYLRDVFTRLPSMNASQIPELTPAAWAKARRAGKPVPVPAMARVLASTPLQAAA